jgi:hypothetical protein
MKTMSQKIIFFIFLGLLSSCSGSPKIERNYEDYHPPADTQERQERKMKSLITKGNDSIVIYGDRKNSDNGSNSAISNSYLWKAALDTVSFMPLVSTDSNGGTILTDWHSNEGSANERFKFNIFILNQELKTTSIKVVAFKQVKLAGQWQNQPASKKLLENMEDAIIKKAIVLRDKKTSKK